jgi:MmyB-like transcription regulator ligand binding domain
VARLAIAQSTRYPGDPRLTALVGELSVKDAQFRQWWADRQVNLRSSGVKKLRHLVAGELTLNWTAPTSTPSDDACACSPPGLPSVTGRLRTGDSRHAPFRMNSLLYPERFKVARR